MKQFTVLMAVALVSSVLLSGCGKKEEAPPPAPAPAPSAVAPAPSTPPPAAEGQNAPATPAPLPPTAAEAPKAPESTMDLLASAKSGVEQAMTLAKDGKYQESLALLQQKATEVQSNPDAMKLINDAMAQVKKMMADAAAKGAARKVGGG